MKKVGNPSPIPSTSSNSNAETKSSVQPLKHQPQFKPALSTIQPKITNKINTSSTVKPSAPKPKPVETVPSINAKPGEVPPPPPLIIHKAIVPQTTSSSSSSSSKKSSSKPIDLASELAMKKKQMKKVEVKEYISPALKKVEQGHIEEQQSTNTMMAMLMAQRNKLKKKGN